MEQIQQQLAMVVQQMADLQAQYAAATASNASLHQQAQASAAAAQAAQAQAAAAVQAAQQAAQQQAQTQHQIQHHPVVDIRGIGKPATFDPKNMTEEAKFNTWSFKLTSFLNSHVAHARHLMRWATEQTIDIGLGDLHRECQGAGISNLEAERVQLQLYALLVSVTEGEAATIVEKSGEDNGLEAFRRLTKRYDPSNAGRKRAILDTILSFPQVKMPELRRALEDMKKLIGQYETRHKKNLG